MVWVIVGSLVGFVVGICLPSKEIWEFNVSVPTVPKFSFTDQHKVWRIESFVSSPELIFSIANKYGSAQPKNGAYVSVVQWPSGGPDPYLSITMRSPSQQFAMSLTESILNALNAEYATEVGRVIDEQHIKFGKLMQLRETIQSRIGRMEKGADTASSLAGAVVDLLGLRIQEIDRLIDEESGAFKFKENKRFKLLDPENGALIGRYPNIGLSAILGAILGLAIGVLFQLFYFGKPK